MAVARRKYGRQELYNAAYADGMIWGWAIYRLRRLGDVNRIEARDCRSSLYQHQSPVFAGGTIAIFATAFSAWRPRIFMSLCDVFTPTRCGDDRDAISAHYPSCLEFQRFASSGCPDRANRLYTTGLSNVAWISLIMLFRAYIAANKHVYRAA